MAAAMPSRDPDIEKLDRICADPIKRRQLLWVRAQEKEDLQSIAMLERADPTLRSRMSDLMDRSAFVVPDLPRERRRAFARLWHQLFENS
jgi:hypothetical protein